MANPRQETILRLIQQYAVTTQEQLRDLLAENGYPVTQATVSRDIRQLQLRKEQGASGVHRYVRGTVGSAPTKLLTDTVRKIDFARNTVVLTCHAGTAQAACTALDGLSLPEVVGSIAGDDTIFVLTRSERDAEQLVVFLQSHIWG